MREEDLIHNELSGKIIGCAMKVHNTLKPGLELALLLNFKYAKLQTKRVVKQY